MSSENEPPAPSDGSQAPKTRRGYDSPKLVQYGSVARLTQGTLTTQSDGPKGGKKMKCL
jgi:hypothetical protein